MDGSLAADPRGLRLPLVDLVAPQGVFGVSPQGVFGEPYFLEFSHIFLLNTLALYGSIVTSNLHAVNMLARSSCERVASSRQSFRNALFLLSRKRICLTLVFKKYLLTSFPSPA